MFGHCDHFLHHHESKKSYGEECLIYCHFRRAGGVFSITESSRVPNLSHDTHSGLLGSRLFPSSEFDVTPEVLTDPLSNTCITRWCKKCNLTMVHRVRMIENKQLILVTQDIGDFLSVWCWYGNLSCLDDVCEASRLCSTRCKIAMKGY